MQTSRPLSVLLVEDEAILSIEVEDRLADLGFTDVETASTLSEGVDLASRGRHDVAIVDFRLGERLSWPIAEILERQGVPFAFVTGDQHGEIGERFPDVPVLQKPYDPTDFDRLVSFLAGRVPVRDRRSHVGGGDDPSTSEERESPPPTSDGGPSAP